MYNGTTTSLKTILWKVMNHPLAADLSYELAAEYALEGIKLIGAPLSLVNKVSDPIKIQGHKAALPLNVVEIRGIRGFDNIDDDESKKYAMTIASDLYHNSDCKETNDLCSELTYTVQQGIISTSFSDGYVEVSFKALPVDEDGFPLIPNNQKVLLAIEFYILERFFMPLWSMGKISDKAYEKIDQKKCWYMGAANTNMQLSGYDHVEAIMNSINRIIVNSNAHSNFFKKAGKKEQFKRYN